MNDLLLSATEAIEQVKDAVAALPACIAGSAVASEAHGLLTMSDYSDVDIFCFTPEAVMVGVERLTRHGFIVEPRHSRVHHRWLNYGMPAWHTNSLKLDAPGIEVNLIYKSLNRRPLTSLAQVLESFDFGLLAMGHDLTTGTYHDMRSYLFPGLDINGPLPLMPARRDAWRGGFISQYQAMREVGRYAKYKQRGFDMSLITDDLIEGYMAAASYQSQRTEADRILLSRIYYGIADAIILDDLDQLIEMGKTLVTLDSLDEIMDALE